MKGEELLEGQLPFPAPSVGFRALRKLSLSINLTSPLEVCAMWLQSSSAWLLCGTGAARHTFVLCNTWAPNCSVPLLKASEKLFAQSKHMTYRETPKPALAIPMLKPVYKTVAEGCYLLLHTYCIRGCQTGKAKMKVI